ncbi:WxL domain-containing protein [Enterococcus faecium]|uniref:WxL domain-containing protein n=1 Tax=Enterococcus faecium TaxID=1352 RepID=UPI0009372455|nr:WxL domain-containing protein [Enterococcus faecium]
MKKQVFYTLAATVLLSSSLLSTLNVQADETEPTKDSATSTAKITFTGDNGPLSIDYVSNITFGTKDISTTSQVYNAENAEPHVQITDKRGVEGGWTLTAAATKFVASDNSELKGAELLFKNGVAETTSDNTSKAPVTSDLIFDNTEAKTVMTADSLKGQGTWLDVFKGTEGNNTNVQLSVPSGSAQAKEYTSTITWTLTAGPTA